MPNTPPSGLIRYFQTKTIRPPTSIPASAPCQLQRFQNSAQSITAPNAPPNPAHAKLTMPKTLESGSRASTTPTTLTHTMVRRAANRLCFSLSLRCANSCKMFWETLDAAASIWLSAVDMVAARIPARMRPASTAANAPWALMRLAMRTMRVSLVEPLRNSSTPALVMPRPTMPMTMEAVMAMTTHTEAMRRLRTSFFSSSMAMKRSRMWGIPK